MLIELWALLAVIIIVSFAYLKLNSTPRILMHNTNQPNTHRWDYASDYSLALCAYCNKPLEGWFRLEGIQCKVCGVSCHHFCARKIKTCKLASVNTYKDSWSHDWKKVFIAKERKCSYCSSLCGSVYDNSSFQCSWCAKCVHQKCVDLVVPDCDMGACKNHSIHPAYVKMPNKKEKISLRIEKLPKDIQPIVIIINPKSGGQIGETALKAFYSLVNPIQVIDVFCDYSRLKLFENMSDLRILIAGGDGTVSKLLGTLYDDDWKGEKPPIGIFPLGTGNDLSVVFNWGKGIKSRKGKNIGSMIECARDVIKSACKAYPSNLDRWVVRFTSKNKVKSFTMCNYLGIGVDAKIADDFDKLRKSKPYLFQSRRGNRIIYSHLGGMEIINKAFKNFTSRINVNCDGKSLEIPSLEGILFLNIPSYAGGVDLWGNRDDFISDSSESFADKKSFALQDKQDGLLEMAGIYNSLHLGECQVGFSQVLKLGQGRKYGIEISGKEDIVFQIDGEPYTAKGPVSIEIFHKDQVKILVKATERYHYVAKKALDVISWACDRGVIDATQKNIILDEFSRRSKV